MGRPPRITKEQLLRTARALFVRKGFDRTTLADIAEALEVTPAALLRYADSKQHLFEQAMASRAFELPGFIKHLEVVDPTSDPRAVLREFASDFIPFIRGQVEENFAIYMHRRSHFSSITLPFDPQAPSSPPARALGIIEGYFRRAAAAGAVRIRDPRAAAIIFMGSLHSYVLYHYVFRLAPRPYPVERVIDQLIDVWAAGAFSPRSPGKPRSRKGVPNAKK